MDSHVRIFATLSIIFGICSGVATCLILAIFGGPGALWTWAEASGGFGLIATATVLLHLAVSVPVMIGGIFLLGFHEWARYFMVVLCAINLLNPPFGTLLGAYGLWVLMTPETEPLFLDRVLRRHYRPPP